MEERKETLHVGLLTTMARIRINKGMGEGLMAPPRMVHQNAVCGFLGVWPPFEVLAFGYLAFIMFTTNWNPHQFRL